jgi:hypothetical protein
VGLRLGAYGVLGLDDTARRLVPAWVGADEAFGQSKVLTIACGFCHSMAVTEEGGLWSWGRGYAGRLGHNDQGDRMVPTRVATERFGGAKVPRLSRPTADVGGGDGRRRGLHLGMRHGSYSPV